jgi:UDP-N-acetylmuramate dehydrogenase
MAGQPPTGAGASRLGDQVDPAALTGLARALGSRARSDAPLGSLTTYRVGGSAALLARVADEAQLVELAQLAAPWTGRVPVLVVGRGSNLLVADAGFAGLAVLLGPGFESMTVTGNEVVAGAAVSLPVLARRTAAAGLTGLEWAVGVPGSVGGAVRMNAGGHGSDVAATLAAYRGIDLTDGAAFAVTTTGSTFGYRRSPVAATQVVVEGRFVLRPGSVDGGAATIAEIVRWRRANQPGGSNAGSVFVNPPDDSAGRLIDACGLKGMRLGTAEVSSKHANFIQADAGGSADDVAALMAAVRRRVADATGVELCTEVRMVGFGSGGNRPEAGVTDGGAIEGGPAEATP